MDGERFENRKNAYSNKSDTCERGVSQEPITRSIQLQCVRAKAFSQVGLFLDLSVFPVKISVSDDVHIKYTNFP